MYSKEELKQLNINFWQLFDKRCGGHSVLKYRRRKWVLHKTKIKGVALRFDVNRQDAKVLIELGNKNENLRFKAYEFLEKYKVVLETGFENGLIWEFYHEREDSGAEICRIYTCLPNVDFHRQNQWPDIFDFFIENMLKLETNFLEIRDLLQEALKR
ncbi:DUF4268 domain-containing protein [uncultured Draconibacterium sp.]|uniref:DUF4268 domain-containing protein n=1 Tax=uncultured Draconibacterium sp. TaxID=1573823 RepID=UPI0025F6DF5A|nr:DUF4268 domain-containing protein [uncultured Draconibacterium sp.]